MQRVYVLLRGRVSVGALYVLVSTTQTRRSTFVTLRLERAAVIACLRRPLSFSLYGISSCWRIRHTTVLRLWTRKAMSSVGCIERVGWR